MNKKDQPGMRLPLEGPVNFRDLGGYETTDHRRVKKGELFRSDGLSRLTEKDHQTLKKIGIRLVCDLRAPSEVKMSPDNLPENDPPEYLNLPVSREDFDTIAAFERLKLGDTSWLTDTFMIDGYRNNIDDFGSTWGTIFNRIAVSGGRPMVFHCTAGKDRTGVCAALIFLVLGVPEETIIYDHSLSNIYIKDTIDKISEYIRSFGVDPESVSQFFIAPRDAMESVLDHIRHKYGSAEDYLIKMAGVSPETLEILRKELLEE